MHEVSPHLVRLASHPPNPYHLQPPYTQVANKRGILVISDEIYGQIYFGEDHCAPSVLECSNYDPERTVVVSGVSKVRHGQNFSVLGMHTRTMLGRIALGAMPISTALCDPVPSPVHCVRSATVPGVTQQHWVVRVRMVLIRLNVCIWCGAV